MTDDIKDLLKESLIHHKGYACSDIESAILELSAKYRINNINQTIFDPLQDAQLCFLDIDSDPDIELVAGKAVKGILDGLNTGLCLYHICYEVENIEQAMHVLKENNYFVVKELRQAKLFNERRVSFLQNENGLVELLEKNKIVPDVQISIAATFTPDSIVNALVAFSKEVGFSIALASATYGQVFQSLFVSPESHVQIFLVRPEDFLVDLTKIKTKQLFGNILNEFSKQLLHYASKWSNHKIILIVCPASYDFAKEKIYHRQIEFKEGIVEQCEKHHNLFFLDLDQAQYHKENYYDRYSEQHAHMPYSAECERCLSEEILRKVHAVIRLPYKVIVLDADNTLWDGVCAGEVPVVVSPPRLLFQKLLREQYMNGVLLCVCSKNNPKDVFRVFDARSDMLLKKEHVASFKINWKSKSANILSLAKQLNLGLDTFIFIDDNPMECAEVFANCPDVLVLNLPCETTIGSYKTFFNSIWAFDLPEHITSADLGRTLLYKQDLERVQIKRQSVSFSDFLSSLNVVVNFGPITSDNVGRVVQLMLRVNQFNLTGNKDNVGYIVNATKRFSSTVTVSDKFGNYGLVGFFQYSVPEDGSAMVVSELLLSCRVLNRGVEFHILKHLIEIARKYKKVQLKLRSNITEKNKPLHIFLSAITSRQEKSADCILYMINTSEKPCVKPFDYFQKITAARQEKASDISLNMTRIKDNEIIKNALNHAFTTNVSQDVHNKGKNTCPIDKVTIKNTILHAFREYVQDTDIKVSDDFFRLGGTSLMAIRMLAHIFRVTAVELTLPELYQNPKVSDIIALAARKLKKDVRINVLPLVSADNENQLSSMQELIISSQTLLSSKYCYNMPVILKLEGQLNTLSLKKAFAALISKYAIFRTNYYCLHAGFFQRITEKPALPFHYYQPKTQVEIAAIIENEEKYPFDLENELPIRISLLMIDSASHILVVNIHHLVADGFSYKAIKDDIAGFYRWCCASPDGQIDVVENLQYFSFISSQKKWISEGYLSCQELYWKDYIDGLPGIISANKLRKMQGAIEPACVEFDLESQYCHLLKRIASSNGASEFMVFLSIFFLALNQEYGWNHFYIGVPSSARGNCSFSDAVGCFTNLLPIYNQAIEREIDFTQLIEYAKTVLAAHIANQELPFQEILKLIKKKHGMAASIDVLFIMHDLSDQVLSLDGLHTSRYQYASYIARAPLAMEVIQNDKSRTCLLYYDENIFSSEKILCLRDRIASIMICLANNDRKFINNAMVRGKYFDDHVELFGQNRSLSGTSILKSFYSNAFASPHHEAISYKSCSYSYENVNNRASQIAVWIEKQGVKPGDIVCVSLAASHELILLLLAVMKVGAIYFPMDVNIDSNEANELLHLVKPSILIASKTESVFTRCDFPLSPICIDFDETARYGNYHKWIRKNGYNSNNDVVYVFMTSGSTGAQKVIQVSEYSILNMCIYCKEQLELSEGDRVLQYSSPFFDSFFWEVFPALMVGATIVILPSEERTNGLAVSASLLQHKITHVTLPAAFMPVMVKHDIPSLKKMVISGDLCPYDVLKEWSKDTDVYIGYGLTETTVCASVAKFHLNSSNNNIGYPMYNTAFYLPIDSENGLMELSISGKCLAKSCVDMNGKEQIYGNKYYEPKETDVYVNYYRTGDLFKIDLSGELFFQGRNDSQVKIRGKRISLNYVKAAIESNATFCQCALLPFNMRQEQKLLAFVALPDLMDKQKATIGLLSQIDQKLYHELISSLEDKLSERYIPDVILVVNAIPLNKSGKHFNEKLLESYKTLLEDNKREDAQRIDCTCSRKNTIKKIWEDVLGVSVEDDDANFFDLGGTSLTVSRLYYMISKKIDHNIPIAKLYEYPTLRKFSEFLDRHFDDDEGIANGERTLEAVPFARNGDVESHDIAIIGISCRFPGADNHRGLWRNLLSKCCSIKRFSMEELKRKGVDDVFLQANNYVPVSGCIEDVDQFALDYFGFTPVSAEQMDPQHRLFLEACWQSLQDAGCSPARYHGKIGVFSSVGENRYYERILLRAGIQSNPGQISMTKFGNEKDFLPTTVSYKLQLNGPSFNISSGCSSSLVAVAIACNNLRCGQTDIALAGGVSIILPQELGYSFQKESIYSRDGECRPFDIASSGTVRSSGAGVVVLKRLNDALRDNDHIYAVISGVGLNNDGHNKVGFVAPSIPGQVKCIKLAQDDAKIRPDEVNYIEAHGTGTKVGDQIEAEALSQVFRANKKSKTYIGAIKANIGHADVASGIAGLIKTALICDYKMIPPQANFTRMSNDMAFNKSSFAINTEICQDYSNMICGVSSFGLGGTNAHLILKSPPDNLSKPLKRSRERSCMICLSAANESLYAAYKKTIISWIEHSDAYMRQVSLKDLECTLLFDRQCFSYKKIFCCDNVQDLYEKLCQDKDDSIEKIHLCKVEPFVKDCVTTWFKNNGLKCAAPNDLPYQKVSFPVPPLPTKSCWFKNRGVSAGAKMHDETPDVFERILTSIWKEVLGIANIEASENVVDKYADSLLILEFIAKLSKAADIELGINDVFEHRTIKQQCDFLHNKNVRMANAPALLSLREGDASCPIFLIHPGSGLAFHYEPFVAALDVPYQVYCIQNPVSNDTVNQHNTLEEMAADYIPLIKSKQPDGPYIIAGWSFGASVAFELAKQLLDQHDKVLSVGLFDGWAKFPECLKEKGYFEKLDRQKFAKYNDIGNMDEWLNLLWRRVQLMVNYQPTVIEAPVTLFKAKNITPEYECLSDPCNLWGKLVASKINVVDVPGEHQTLLDLPMVKVLAEKYSSAINALENERGKHG